MGTTVPPYMPIIGVSPKSPTRESLSPMVADETFYSFLLLILAARAGGGSIHAMSGLEGD